MSRGVLYKKDIIELYSKSAAITKKEASERIDAVLDLIKISLVAGYDVMLVNFFNFYNREYKEKVTHDFVTESRKTIPAKRYIHVKTTEHVKRLIT